MKKAKRELGFYWVKMADTHVWEVAQLFAIWDSGQEGWFVVGDEYDYSTDDFEEIGAFINPPKE